MVSPTHDPSKGKNTLRQDLIPVACWKLRDEAFAFGSSFISAETKADFEALASLCNRYVGAPLSLFGHADPVGDDEFNKSLSGNRAEAVFGVLTRDTALWETLYQSGSQGWGSGAVYDMLAALGYPESSDGIRQFQAANGLAADGVAGPATRSKLFAAYMDYLCPRKWTPAEFLGAGADAKRKAAMQGCSEFNPVLVFSKAESDQFARGENIEKRNTDNCVNRRVIAYLFRPGTVVNPSKWPCPTTNEGASGCRKRLWSDGDIRRSPQGERREYGDTGDTFACRFYDRLSAASPCEGVIPPLVDIDIPLEADLDSDPDKPDRIRLRHIDGIYESELEQGGPDVTKDGTYPLYHYHFKCVPPGLYSVEVKLNDEWRLLLRGLQISPGAAVLGKQDFTGSTSGEPFGTPSGLPVAELADDAVLDLGCC